MGFKTGIKLQFFNGVALQPFSKKLYWPSNSVITNQKLFDLVSGNFPIEELKLSSKISKKVGKDLISKIGFKLLSMNVSSPLYATGKMWGFTLAGVIRILCPQNELLRGR